MKTPDNSRSHKTERPVVELKRDLGLWSAVAIVVGTVIGSGIFLVPRTMIQRVGTPELVFVVWVVGGLLSQGRAREKPAAKSKEATRE